VNLVPSEEHEQLRSSVRSFLQDQYSFEARRAALNSKTGYRPELWSSLATDLGLLSMSLPERAGGFASDAGSTAVIMEEFGRALVLEPYLETVVICGGLLAQCASAKADETLTKIGEGKAILAFAAYEPRSRFDFARIATTAQRQGSGWQLDGTKAVVLGAPWASQLLVTARSGGQGNERQGISLFLIDTQAPGVTLRRYTTIDGRHAADVILDKVRVGSDALLGDEGQALPLLEQIGDAAIAALSAEAVGILGKLLEDTVEYTKQRKQFGQPISTFQVLQHRMVDMYTEIEMARSAAFLATMELSAAPQRRALAASAAKVTIGKACRFVGQSGVQLHGGMGTTDELPLSHYFKRATVIEAEFGTVDFHLSRYAALSRREA
jgi:alkylation response protein AidB-like acyl-CoA dehydrogenase